MELVTYRKYKSEEEASALLELLKLDNIEYSIENIASAVDITFTGGTGLEDKIAIKLQSSDFEKVDSLLNQVAVESFDLVDEDHYLFDFTDDELLEVLENYNEWSKTDYVLAQDLLKKRGKGVSDEKVQALKEKKIAALSKAEKGHKGWLIFGFISAVLGGFLGIFIGYHHFKFKKSIPTGERVYAYDAETRKTGLRIFYIGMIALLFWLFLFIVGLN